MRNMFLTSNKFTVEILLHFLRRFRTVFIKPILKFSPPKWTINEDFRYWIWALADQICTVKTSDRSEMNPKQFLSNIAISVQRSNCDSLLAGIRTELLNPHESIYFVESWVVEGGGVVGPAAAGTDNAATISELKVLDSSGLLDLNKK